MNQRGRGVSASRVERRGRQKCQSRRLPARRMMRNGHADLAAAFVYILEMKMRGADDVETGEGEEREAQDPAAQFRTTAFGDMHRP